MNELLERIDDLNTLIEQINDKERDYLEGIKKQVDDKLEAIMKGGHFSDDG